MDIAKSDAPLSRSEQPPRGRAALARFHALFDSQIRPEVVSVGSPKRSGGAVEDYFDTLLNQQDCYGAWEAYTRVDNGFPRQLADGTAPLNGFRHYMLQDAIYLEYYVRVRMEATARWGSKVSSGDLRKFVATVPDGLSYSEKARSDCETKLGIQGKVIKNEWKNYKSSQLETSIGHYERVITGAVENESNSWLDIHFALLPCIKGYYTIAKALLQDPATIRNTLYYSLWIEGNADETYVNEYDAFIHNNIGSPTPEQWARWGKIFKQACENELDFFSLAIRNFQTYDIVSAGSYIIRPFVGNETYFLSVAGGEVVISDQPAQWELINSEDGYFIKLADKKFLNFDGKNVAIQNTDPTNWSINPVFIPGNSTYQLFLAGAIHLALDVDTDNKVSVAKNDATSQTWILSLSSA